MVADLARPRRDDRDACWSPRSRSVVALRPSRHHDGGALLGARARAHARRRRRCTASSSSTYKRGRARRCSPTCPRSCARWPRPACRGAPSPSPTAPTSADRLPDGLDDAARPRHLRPRRGVARSIWLEEVRTAPRRVDLARYERAAYLLGRLAASPRGRAELANVGEFDSHRAHLCRRTARRAGHPRSARHRGLAPPADRRRVRRRAARAAAGRGRTRRRRYADELMALPRAHRATATPAPTTCSRPRHRRRSCSSTTASGSPSPSASTSASCWSARSSSAAAAPTTSPRATPPVSRPTPAVCADEGMRDRSRPSYAGPTRCSCCSTAGSPACRSSCLDHRRPATH